MIITDLNLSKEPSYLGFQVERQTYTGTRNQNYLLPYKCLLPFFCQGDNFNFDIKLVDS